MTANRPGTEKLLELIEKAPLHTLSKAIRKHTNPSDLLEVINIASRKMQDGHASRWGQLGFEEIGSLSVVLDRQIELLSKKSAREQLRQLDEFTQRPYLASQLRSFDPRGEKKPNNETKRRDPKPGGGRRRRRRRDDDHD